MSSALDEKVVEMRFENENFEEGANQSIKTLDRLQNALTMKSTSTPLDKLSELSSKIDFTSITDGIDTLAYRFSTLGLIGATVLQNLTNELYAFGSSIVKSITLDPILDGFGEYELKLQSIQTIQSNTTNTIEEISGYLDELNTYADKTIYSFADMTDNIGKFTAAGVDLKTAVEAIQGMSNLSAMSGATTQQNARAMYNTAQALATGAMRLVDWRSLENAGIGGKGFQNVIRETAKEMGVATDVLKQLDDGTLSFRDSLQKAWVTNDVFLAALKKYSALDENGNPMGELAKKAYEAATKIKSYTQLIQTLRESVGSGWAESWEYIFGEIDEAKSMWTAVYEEIDGILAKSTKARNDLLKTWKDAGGRDALLGSIANMWNGVKDSITPVMETFKSFLPSLDGKQLAEYTKKFQELTKSFKLSESTIELLKQGVSSVMESFKKTDIISANMEKLRTGLRSVTNIAKNFSTALMKGIVNALPYASAAFVKFREAISNVVGTISEFVTSIDEKLLSSGFYDKITTGLSFLGESLGKVVDIIGRLGRTITTSIKLPSFSSILDGLLNAIDIFAKSPIPKLFATIVNGVIGAAQKLFSFLENTVNNMNIFSLYKFKRFGEIVIGLIGKFEELGDIKDILTTPGKIFMDISGAIDDLGDSCQQLLFNNRLDGLKTVATTLLELGAALWLLSGVPTDNIGKLAGILAGLVGAMTAVFYIMTKITSISSGGITGWKGFVKSLGELILGGGAMWAQSQVIMAAGNAFLKMGAALIMMAGALLMISSIKPDQLVGSMVALVSMLGGLVGALYIMKALQLERSTKGLVGLGLALIEMAAALKILSTLPTDNIGDTMLVFAGIVTGLIALASTMNALNGLNMLGVSAAAVILAGALLVIAGVVAVMSTISLQTVVASLGKFELMLVALGLTATALAPTALSMAAIGGGLVVLAAGIGAVTLAIILASAIPFGKFVKSILAVEIALTGLSLTALALSAIAPAMLLAAGGIAAIGAACVVAGAGIAAIAVGLDFLISGVNTAGNNVVNFLGNLSKQVLGINNLVNGGVADVTKTATEGIEEVILTSNENITNSTNKLAETAVGTMNTVSENVSEQAKNLPVVAGEAATETAGAFSGIGENTMSSFLDGIRAMFPDVEIEGDAIGTAFYSYLQSSGVIDETTSIAGFVGEGWISTLQSFNDPTITAATTWGSLFTTFLASSTEVASPSKATMRIARWCGVGFIKGLESSTDDISKASYGMGTAAIDGLRQAADILSEEGIAKPKISPVMDLANVDSGVKQINSMFSDIQAINASINTGSNNESTIGLLRQLLSAVKDGRVVYLDGDVVSKNVNRRLGML